MKGRKKLIALVAVASISATVLVGCSTSWISLFSAVNKTSTIKSAEVYTDISVKVTAKNLSKAEAQEMGKLSRGAELHMVNKFVEDKSKDTLKAQTDIKGYAGEDNIETTIWSDINGSSTKETIKLPKKYSDKVLELKGKDYLIATDTATDSGIDYDKISSLEPKLTAFLEAYMSNYNPSNDPIKSVGTREIVQHGKKQTVKVYQLNLTDSSLKSLIHYTVKNLPNNKESLGLLEDYVVSVVTATTPKDLVADSVSQVKSAFDGLTSNLSLISQQLDASVSAFDKVKMLGDKGVSINFSVNKDGYIVNENGDIQIVVDTPAINKVIGDTSSTDTGIYTATVHFNNDIENINGKVVISYPKTDAKNSITMSLDKALQLGQVYDAHILVDKAAKECDPKEVEIASEIVNTLPDGVDKKDMLAQISKAENNILIAKAQDAVKKVKSSLLLEDYNNALVAIIPVQGQAKQKLTAELNSMKSKVITSDIASAQQILTKFALDDTKTLREYDSAKQAIAKTAKNVKSKDYLLKSLNQAENKKVFTADVNNALKAIDTAKAKYTAANVKAAQTAISKVKSKDNAAYLQEKLKAVKPVIK